jgi:hypothetical protein
MIDLQITFSSRRPGSFGSGPFGNVLEWWTTNWFRFTCLLVSAFITIGGLSSKLPASEKVFIITLAPVLATMTWGAFLLVLLFCRYLGTFGQVFAHLLIIYFFLFSRLVVQHPPKLWLPITPDKR